MPEADLDFGIVDQLLRPAGEAVLTAETGAPTSSFAVGARLLEVVGEQLVTGQWSLVDSSTFGHTESKNPRETP